MKKIFSFIGIFCIIFSGVNIFFEMPVLATDIGKYWDVFFTPQHNEYNSDFEIQLSEIIKTAQHSIDITSYTWGESSHNLIIQALNLKFSQGISVRIIGDNDNPFSPYINPSIPRVMEMTDDLMHDKFIIIDAGRDNAKFIGGSTNWTDGAFSQQNNNAIVFYNKDITQVFEDKFNLMWSGNFFNKKTATTGNKFNMNGHTLEIYFAPEDDPGFTKLVPLINNAKKSVLFCSNKMKVVDFANACLNAKNNGAVVEGVYDRLPSEWYKPVVDIYLNHGIDARKAANSFTMHHKFYVIDMEYVITGSLNQSTEASKSYAENIVIVNDPALARFYAKEVKRLFEMTSGPDPMLVGNSYHNSAQLTSVKNVSAIPTAAGQFYVTWNKIKESRFNRYLIYIQDNPIYDITNLRPEKTDITDKNVTNAYISTYNEGLPLSATKNYYIAVTAIDNFGNESRLDAGSIVGPLTTTGQIVSGNLEFLTATDGTNTITTFNNEERLKCENITISFQIQNSIASDNVKVYWSLNGVPSTNAASCVAVLSDNKWTVVLDKNKYSNNDKIYFNIYYNGNKKGLDYKFIVDNFSPVPENIRFNSIGKSNIKLSWSIPSRYSDVSKYRVYYSKTADVNKNSSFKEFTENYGTVTGLTESTEYYFGIISIDDLGNESDMSELYSAVTLFKSGAEVKLITDGYNNITDFSGVGVVNRNNITVYFNIRVKLEEEEEVQNSIRFFYDIDAFPDGPNGSNLTQREIPVDRTDTSCRVTIPANDAKFYDGAMVQFGIFINGIMYYNDEIPWRFVIQGNILNPIRKLKIDNITGTSMQIHWDNSNVSGTGFNTYRVYYSEGDTVTLNSSFIDKTSKIPLGGVTTNSVVIDNLKPSKQYYFTVTVLDIYGQESKLGDIISDRTNQVGTILISEVHYNYNSKQVDWIEIYAKEGPVDLRNVYIMEPHNHPDLSAISTSALTVQKGNYAVLYFSDGISEDNNFGDMNNNGYREVYLGSNFSITNPDGIVLSIKNDENIDGVFLKFNDNDTIANCFSSLSDNLSNVNNLWTDLNFDSNSLVYFWGGTSIIRKMSDSIFYDNNSKDDWKITFVSTPGKNNQITNMTFISVNDGTNNFNWPTINNYLKDTDITVNIRIQGMLEYDTMVYLSFATNGVPDGVGSNDDTNLIVTKISSDNFYWNGKVIIPDYLATDKDVVKISPFIISKKGLENINSSEQMLFNVYSFRLDGTFLPEPTELQILGKGTNYATVKWLSKLSSDSASDFKCFRIYYSTTSPVTENSQFITDDKLSNIQTSIYTMSNLTPSDTYYIRVGIMDKVGNLSLSVPAVFKTNDDVSIKSIYIDNLIDTFLLESKQLDMAYNDSIIVTVNLNGFIETMPELFYTKGEKYYPDGTELTDTKIIMTDLSGGNFSALLPSLNQNKEITRFIIRYKDFFLTNQIYSFSLIKNSLAQVSGLKSVGVADKYVSIAWNPVQSIENFKEYRIYYSKNSNFSFMSNCISASQDNVLSDVKTSLYTISGLDSYDTYYFWVALYDIYGNFTISDSIFAQTRPSLKIRNLILSDGTNVITNGNGISYLNGSPVTITIETSEIPDSDILLFWNKNNFNYPDGPGGTNDTEVHCVTIKNSFYEYYIPSQNNNDTVNFILYYKGVSYGVNSTDVAYRYVVDTQSIPKINNFRFDTGVSTQLFIIVSWQSISIDYVNDFKEYRIYYSINSNELSAGSPYFTNISNMRDYKLNMAIIPDLQNNTKYIFAIAAVDKVGNISQLSDTFCINTISMNPFIDPAYDGINTAHKLDGSEYLMDTNIKIVFQFSRVLESNETAYLVYACDTIPNEINSKKIEMVKDNKIAYSFIDCGATPKIKDNSLINYYVDLNGIRLLNNENYFSFKIDNERPQVVTGFRCDYDGGDYAMFVWDNYNLSDFKGYEICYGTTLSERKIINYTNDGKLKDMNLSLYSISNLDKTKNYYFEISAVDNVGYRNFSEKIYLQRVKEGDIKIVAAGETKIKILKNQTVECRVKVLNNDLPAVNYPVKFRMVVKENFFNNNNTEVIVNTDKNGEAYIDYSPENLSTEVGMVMLNAEVIDKKNIIKKIDFIIFYTANNGFKDRTEIFYIE